MLWCSTSFKKIVENDEDCKIDYQIDHLLLISSNVCFSSFQFYCKKVKCFFDDISEKILEIMLAILFSTQICVLHNTL